MPGRKIVSPKLDKSTLPPIELFANEFVQILKDAEHPVATCWLTREEKRNALGPPVLAAIEQAFLFLQTRFDLDVVVLAGKGKSFSAGAEVASGGFAPGDPDKTGPSSQRERRHASMLGSRVIRAIMEVRFSVDLRPFFETFLTDFDTVRGHHHRSRPRARHWRYFLDNL